MGGISKYSDNGKILLKVKLSKLKCAKNHSCWNTLHKIYSPNYDTTTTLTQENTIVLTQTLRVGVVSSSTLITSVSCIILLTYTLTRLIITDTILGPGGVTITESTVRIGEVSYLTFVTLGTAKLKPTVTLSCFLITGVILSTDTSTAAGCNMML